MSNLIRKNIYKPDLLFFEMQQFRQNYVCWFAGPYNTRKVKFSNSYPLEIWNKNLHFKTSFVETGSYFYKTMSHRNLQQRSQKINLWQSSIKHWIVGTLVGFQNALRVRGVGYRFDISPLKITINAGYSHLIFHQLPVSNFLQSLTINKKSTLMKMKSSDLMFLQTFISSVRNSRPPDVYKGKGLRYQKDFIFRKEGKKKKTT